MISPGKKNRRIIALFLAVSLTLPAQFLPVAAFAQSGVLAPPQTSQPVPETIHQSEVGAKTEGAASEQRKQTGSSRGGFRQLVVYVPDVFDRPEDVARALRRLQAKGVAPEDIIDLTQQSSFNATAGLKEQAAMLSRIVARESAKRQGLKAHLVAKGTGGLAAKAYLIQAKQQYADGAPVEDVVGLGVPHKGRLWAKAAYALAMPLPKAGMRCPAIRDLSPDSDFMLSLRHYETKKTRMIEDATAVLKKVDDFEFKKAMRTRLAAMDQTKKAVSDHVERILNFPERVKLGEQDKQRVATLKKAHTAAAKSLVQFQSQLASQAGPEALRQTAGRLGAQKQALAELVQAKTDSVGEHQGALFTNQDAKKIADLNRLVRAKADQAKAAMQSRVNAGVRQNLRVLDKAPEDLLRDSIRESAVSLQTALKDPGLQQSLEKITQTCAQEYADGERMVAGLYRGQEMEALCQAWRQMEQQKNALCDQISRTVHQSGEQVPAGLARRVSQLRQLDLDVLPAQLDDLRKKYAEIGGLQSQWDRMQDARQAWQAQIATLAAAQSDRQMQSRITEYMEGLATQVETLPDSAELQSQWQDARTQWENMRPKVVAQADVTAQTEKLQALRQTYQQAKTSYLQSLESLPENMVKQVVKPEYLTYLKRFDRIDETVMQQATALRDNGDQAPALSTALIALEKSGAAEEMEMFGSATQKRMARELSRVESKLQALDAQALRQEVQELGEKIQKDLQAVPALQSLKEGIKTLSGEQAGLLNRLDQDMAGINEGVQAWKSLDQLGKVREQAATFLADFQKQETAITQSHLSQQAIAVLDRLEDVEQNLKQNQSAAVFEKALPQAGQALQKLVGLAETRRAVVQGMQQKAMATLEQAKTLDVTRFAAQVESVLGEDKSLGKSLWDLADLKSQQSAKAGQAMMMLGKFSELKSAAQAAQDAMTQQGARAMAISNVREAAGRLAVLEAQQNRIQETESLLTQLDQSRQRLDALQGKATEYRAELARITSSLGTLPETSDIRKSVQDQLAPVLVELQQKAGQAAESFARSQWEDIRKDLQTRLAQQTRALAEENALAKTAVEKAQAWLGDVKLDNLFAENQYSSVSQMLDVKIRDLSKQLEDNPAHAIQAQFSQLQRDFQQQAYEAGSKEIAKLFGENGKTFFKQFGADSQEISQQMQAQFSAITQSLSVEVLADKVGSLFDARQQADQVLTANQTLFRQGAVQQAILSQLDKLQIEQTSIAAVMDRLPREARMAMQITGIENEIKQCFSENGKIDVAISMLTKQLQTRAQSINLQYNSDQLASLGRQAMSNLNIDLPDMEKSLQKSLGKWTEQLSEATQSQSLDVSSMLKDINIASGLSDMERALGQAENNITQAVLDLQSGRAPPLVNALLEQYATPISQAVGDIQKTLQGNLDFIRQQIVRVEVGQAQDLVADLGAQAQALLGNHIQDIRNELAKAGFLEIQVNDALAKPGDLGGGFLNIDNLTQQFGMDHAKQQIANAMGDLEGMRNQFAQGIERQLLEIKRADAAVIMAQITQKYDQLGKEFQQAWERITWQVDPANWSVDSAYNFLDASNFKLDASLLQDLQKNVFRQLAANNPIIQEVEKLRDVTGLLNDLADQGGGQVKAWLYKSDIYQHVVRLSKLQDEVEKLLDKTLEQGTTDLIQGQLGNLMRQIGMENEQIEKVMGSLTGPLKDLVMNSEFMKQLNVLKDLPALIDSNLDSLMGDIKAMVLNSQFIKSIDNLGKDIVKVFDQLAGNVPLNLGNLGEQIFGKFMNVQALGDAAVKQTQVLVEQMGVSGSAMGLWGNLAQGINTLGANLAAGMQNLITMACNVDLGAVFCNFTSSLGGFFGQTGDFMSQVFEDVFAFDFSNVGDWFASDNVWDSISDIISSENLKFDFAQMADGFMKSISDGFDQLVESGMQWVQNRWNEYYGEAVRYYNILMGGPESWWKELTSGKYDKAIAGVVDQYLPPEYKPAASVLGKIYTAFTDKEFKLDWQFIAGLLDDLSKYLDPDAYEKYKDYKEILTTSYQYYQTGREIYTAIQARDYAALISSVSKLTGSLDMNWGPVYITGGGRNRKYGGYVNETGEMFQNQLQEYLASLPPDVAAQVGQYLNGEVDLSQIDYNFDEAEIDLADYVVNRNGNGADGADGDASLDNSYLLEKPDLSDRGASNYIPTPPGCVWDAENQCWKEKGAGHYEIDPKTGEKIWVSDESAEGEGSSGDGSEEKPSLFARTKHVLAEGAKTWVNPSRLGNLPKSGSGSGSGSGQGGIGSDGETGSGEGKENIFKRSAKAALDAADQRASELEAFTKGARDGFFKDSNAENEFLATHRWANRKSREAQQELEDELLALEQKDRELDNVKGIKKYLGKSAVKSQKAGAIAKNIIKEGIYDIPKLGQDLPDAWDSTKEAGKNILKGNWKDAAYAGGKAAGILGQEAGRVSTIVGEASKTLKGAKSMVKAGKTASKAAKAADEVGDAAKTARNTSKAQQAIDSVKDIQKNSSGLKVKKAGWTTAEKANEALKKEGYKYPPYAENTKVRKVKIADDEEFVRVYTSEKDDKLGRWLMKKSDIEGLTPKQIQQKYALPKEPTKIAKVEVPKGTEIRIGKAGPQPQWNGSEGGGIQYELLEKIDKKKYTKIGDL